MHTVVDEESGASAIKCGYAARLKFPGRKDKNLNRFKQIAQN